MAGLVLVLVYPVANAAPGIGGMPLDLPGPVAPLGVLVLPAGIALVWLAPVAETARRWVAAGLLLAVAGPVVGTALPAVMRAAGVPATAESAPQAVGGTGPVITVAMLAQGGTVAVFGWGVRRWLRQADQRTAAKWWTVYPATAVAPAFAMAASLALPGAGAEGAAGSASSDAAPQLIVSAVPSLLGVVNLVVHVGACITGMLAFRRLRRTGPESPTSDAAP